MYVPVRYTYPYGDASVIYLRDETGWSTLNESVMTDTSTEPVVALDSIDRPHLVTIAKIANRFAVRHRWWNGSRLAGDDCLLGFQYLRSPGRVVHNR